MVGGSNPSGGTRRIEGLPAVTFGKPFFVASLKSVKSDAESQAFAMRMHEGKEESWYFGQQSNYVPFP